MADPSRKARLMAIRAAARAAEEQDADERATKKARGTDGYAEEDDAPPTSSEAAVPAPAVHFRNYQPQNEVLGDAVPVDARGLEVDLTPNVDLSDLGDQDITQLAPKKPTWDLERDLAPKLELLERKTQRALMELLQNKLQAGQGGQQ